MGLVELQSTKRLPEHHGKLPQLPRHMGWWRGGKGGIRLGLGFPGATCFFNMIFVIFKTNQCYGRFGKQLTQFSELKVIDWLDFYLGFAVPRRQFWSTHRFAVLRFEACIFVKTNLQQVNSILCLKNIFLEQIACGCVASGLHFFW